MANQNNQTASAFQAFFTAKDFRNAYLEFQKYISVQNNCAKKYLKISQKIFENLDNYTEQELLKKANVARCEMREYLTENLCLLTLIKNPECSESLFIWAKYALEKDSYYEALKTIRAAIDLNPDNPEYFSLHAKILTEMLYDDIDENDKDEYIKMIFQNLTKAIGLDADNVNYHLALARFYIYPQKNYIEAIKSYDKAIELEPENAWFFSNRASVKCMAKDYCGAISDYEKAIKEGDRDYRTYRELVDVYYSNKQENKALELYENAIKDYADNPEMQKEMLIGLATVLGWQKDFKRSEEIYTNLIEKDPEDLRLHTLRADVRYLTKNFELGLEDCDFVLKQNDPDFCDMYLIKGNFLLALKQPGKAIECFNKMIELYPDYYAAYVNKALGLCDLKEYDKAIEALEKAIELYPEFSDSYVQIGWIKFMQKDIESAFKMITKAVEINPENENAYKFLAIIFYIQKDYEKALDKITTAINLNNHTDFLTREYYLRSLVHKKLGNEKEAKIDYDKTFELDPEFNTDDFEAELSSYC